MKKKKKENTRVGLENKTAHMAKEQPLTYSGCVTCFGSEARASLIADGKREKNVFKVI